jgi:arsenite methyltransferase
MRNHETRQAIKEAYKKIAQQNSSCCCSGFLDANSIAKLSSTIGYSSQEISKFSNANLGLGCGNPTLYAQIKEGDTVLDLGCGSGFDCFLAAEKVGKTGKVIGVDVTQEMIQRAQSSAKERDLTNVEFRLGDIEALPVQDVSVDVVISNCVINLCPDKQKVFREAYRVLKPKGRLSISDIVVTKPLSKELKESLAAYFACVAGAEQKDNYLAMIETAGFSDVQVLETKKFQLESLISDPAIQAALRLFGFSIESVKAKAVEAQDAVVSILVYAVKP